MGAHLSASHVLQSMQLQGTEEQCKKRLQSGQSTTKASLKQYPPHIPIADQCLLVDKTVSVL